MIRPSQRHFAPENLDPRLRAGLVGHWIGGGSGLTWQDRSGYGNHGALTNGPLWTLGEGGKRHALAFDGSNDYVNMGDPANGSLDFGTGSFSISLWLKPASLSVLQTLVAKQNGAYSDANGWTLQLGTGGAFGDLVFFNSNGGPAGSLQRSVAGVLRLNEWQRITAVVDYGVALKFYLGASQLALIATFSNWASFSNSQSLNIGVTGAADRWCNGTLDDVRIYNRALSPAEIALLAQPSFLPVVPRRWFVGSTTITTQATAAYSTWVAPAATALTRFTVAASVALSTWVAPSASAQLNRRRSIPISGSRASYSIAGSRASYHIEGS